MRKLGAVVGLCLVLPTLSFAAADPIVIAPNLHATTKQFLGFVSSSKFTAKNCGPVLQEIYSKLFLTSGNYFDLQEVDRHSAEVIQTVFRSRVKLRDRIRRFHSIGAVPADCISSTRDIIRAARFIEDFLGERALLKSGQAATRRGVWEGSAPHVLVNPKWRKLESDFNIRRILKSGDILLSRGGAYSSAAIARIGNNDSQFSHLALVYIDPKTHEIFVIEAHIEVGVTVVPLEDYLSDGKVRSALYRLSDSRLAANAAKFMFEVANMATSDGGNIPYDFSLDNKRHNTLFCSEVVTYGYEAASYGRLKLPTFPSRVDATNAKFLADLGVTVTETFLPSDVEIEPKLEFISEWRDYARMNETRMKDAVLTKIYDWMNRLDYRFHGNVKSFIAKNFVWTARRIPLLSHFFREKFPTNMSRSALATSLVVDDVGAVLYNALDRKQERHASRTGLRMTPNEMHEFLEQFRAFDAARLRDGAKPLFHKLFRSGK